MNLNPSRRRSLPRPWRRTLFLAAALLAGASFLSALWFSLPRNPVSPQEFAQYKGRLQRVEVLEKRRVNDLEGEEVKLTSDSGLAIRCLLLHPDTAGVRLPVLILQGGMDRGRETLRPIPKNHRPLLWAAFDYPYQLPRKKGILAHVPEVPRAYRGMKESVAAFSLVQDYLETRPDVDTSRIVAGGASLGGYLAVIAGAVDPRFDGVAALYCGGRLDLLMENILKIKAPSVRRAIVLALNPWLTPIDPVRFVSRIAPRPLLMVNGLDDTTIPRQCALALYEAAGDPKEMLWLDTPHSIVNDSLLMQDVAAQVYSWMERQNLGLTAPPAKITPPLAGSPLVPLEAGE